MSLLILGRAGESRIVTNLGDEIEIRILRIEADRVLLDVTARKKASYAVDLHPVDVPVFLRPQAD
jgi:sRNA-binding carbon storage regulator CsrA